MSITASNVTAGDDILDTDHNKVVTDLTALDAATISIQTRFLPLSWGDAVDASGNAVFDIGSSRVGAGNNAGTATVLKGVQLPEGAIVTSFKVSWWVENQATVTGTADLILHDKLLASGQGTVMASADNTGDGEYDVEDTSISSATIDNSNIYFVKLVMANTAAAKFVYVAGVLITFTVVKALP